MELQELQNALESPYDMRRCVSSQTRLRQEYFDSLATREHGQRERPPWDDRGRRSTTSKRQRLFAMAAGRTTRNTAEAKRFEPINDPTNLTHCFHDVNLFCS